MEKMFWLFCSNPENWNIEKYLLDLKEGKLKDSSQTWSINDKYKGSFKEGQYGFIRISTDRRKLSNTVKGKKLKSGIYAWVKILGAAQERDQELEKSEYDNDSSYKDKKFYVRFKIVENWIDNPLLITTCKEDEVLTKEILLIKAPQSSMNIPITKKSYCKILDLKNIPLPAKKGKNEGFKDDTDDIENTQSLTKTDREAVIKQRLGQSQLRKKVLKKRKCCQICGIEKEELLIVSHIKPWSKCERNEEKLDENNVLLLCPMHDKLFDKGLISFDENGTIMISEKLSKSDIEKMNLNPDTKLKIDENNTNYFEYHRKMYRGLL